jgi:trans-aconitate methyltransferase
MGVDLSPSMVAHARSAYAASEFGNLQFALADARALPFRDAFEVVFSNAVLHWVQDHRPVLDGLRRSLRAGGRLLLQMGGRGNAADILGALERVINTQRWHRYFDDFTPPYTFHSPEDYEAWLKAAGLRPVRVELIPKDMTHPGQAGLEGWLRTTWMAIAHRVPPVQRDPFIAEVASTYLAQYPPSSDGLTHVHMVRLEVEALKS